MENQEKIIFKPYGTETLIDKLKEYNKLRANYIPGNYFICGLSMYEYLKEIEKQCEELAND